MVNLTQNIKNVNTMNIADTINFNTVDVSSEFIIKMNELKEELKKFSLKDQLNSNEIKQVLHNVEATLNEAHKNKPSKPTLINHLETAQQYVSKATGLANVIAGAIKVVGKLTF